MDEGNEDVKVTNAGRDPILEDFLDRSLIVLEDLRCQGGVAKEGRQTRELVRAAKAREERANLGSI